VFSPQEFQERRRRLLMLLESQEIDAVVLFASNVEAGYVLYYSGYESQLGIQDCLFLVVTPGFSREWTLVTKSFWDEPLALPGLNDGRHSRFQRK
jgi:hypothetical protein